MSCRWRRGDADAKPQSSDTILLGYLVSLTSSTACFHVVPFRVPGGGWARVV